MRTRDGEGRTARRLARLLAAAGYTVVRFYPAQGAYRTDVRQDCYRWSAACRTVEGFERTIDSWYTMTALVRYPAVTVDADGDVWPVA